MRVRVRARDPARTRPDLVALTLILTLAPAHACVTLLARDRSDVEDPAWLGLGLGFGFGFGFGFGLGLGPGLGFEFGLGFR